MPGQPWSDDAVTDRPLIARNCAQLLTDLRADAPHRRIYTLEDVRTWHRRIHSGCRVPDASYLGNFRGDPDHPGLVGYEVGVGPQLPDGYPAGVGIWADELHPKLHSFEQGVARALSQLDRALPVGSRPSTVDELRAVVALAAELHGEWVRLHPFANGNGRTARVWNAVVALRYGLPVFVRLRPRPDDIAYASAARSSMGRPPDFHGDHAATEAVFAHLLSLSLLR